MAFDRHPYPDRLTFIHLSSRGLRTFRSQKSKFLTTEQFLECKIKLMNSYPWKHTICFSIMSSSAVERKESTEKKNQNQVVTTTEYFVYVIHINALLESSFVKSIGLIGVEL